MDTGDHAAAHALGAQVQALRRQRGIAAADLGRPWLSARYVEAVEAGALIPSRLVLDLLAERLAIPPAALEPSAAPLDRAPDLAALEEDVAYQLDHAKARVDAGRPAEAAQLIDAIHAGADAHLAALGPRTRYRFHYIRAAAAMRTGDPAAAETDLADALRLAGQLDDGAEDVERVRNLIGLAYYEQDMARQALEQHTACLHAIRRGVVKRLNLKLVIYTNLANDCWALGDLDQAIALYKESLDLLQDTTNAERRAGIYWGLSLAYKAKEDLVRAKLYAGQALAALETVGDPAATAQMQVNLAEIETLRGGYDAAAGLLDAAAGPLEAARDDLGCSILYEHYARLELKRGRLARAEDYARRCRERAVAGRAGRDPADRQGYAHAVRTYGRALRTGGIVAAAQGRRADAEALLDEALDVLGHAEYAETQTEVELDYGELLQTWGEHAAASAHFRRAYAYRQRHG